MKWLWLFLIFMQISCSQAEKKEGLAELQQKQDQLLEDFERANRLLDDGQPQKAAELYDKLIFENPSNQLDMLILYNAGIAYLQSQDCVKASERLRKVIRRTGASSPSLRARAMLRMGDVYICLGEDDKAITNLIELSKTKKNLPIEISAAEIPAKLAVAYARIGNNKEAARYFRTAEKGLRLIQFNFANSEKKTESLAKTLFLMGNMTQINVQKMPMDDYFATIRALQKYLYKSVEYNHPGWSPQALAQLNQAYQNTWIYIEKVPVSAIADEGVAKRERSLEQLRVAQLALHALHELFNNRTPNPDEPDSVVKLMKDMKSHETKLQNFIATNAVGTALTPEALAAEGLKRAGQVLNPDPILEERALRKKQKK